MKHALDVSCIIGVLERDIHGGHVIHVDINVEFILRFFNVIHGHVYVTSCHACPAGFFVF
jgi:hypothetical protein